MEFEAVCNTAATSLAIDWSKLVKVSLEDDDSEPFSVNDRSAEEYFPPMVEPSLPDPSPPLLQAPPEDPELDPPLPPPPLPELGPTEAPDCLKALYMDLSRK